MKAIITEYGAIGDGITLNTISIQKAIDECTAKGGGTVIIPEGIFATGTIELKSNIVLYLKPGAVIKASGDINDYKALDVASDEFKSMRPLIYAIDGRNIRIAGDGEFDLNDKPYLDWNKLWMIDEYESRLNEQQIEETTITPLDRPSQMFFFHQCERLTIEGFAARHCPCYSFLFSVCKDVKIKGITIENDLRGPNTDGMHFYSCKGVIVSGCNISCGDDCIAITGISNWDKVTENFLISDCVMTSRSSGIRIGHMASKVKNVVVNNITITNSNRGIGIFACDGGWVKDVIISNAIIETAIRAGSWWGNGEPLVISAADSSGEISGISINHIHAHSENGIRLVGKNGNISDVCLNDWRLELKNGFNRELFGTKVDLNPMASRPAPEGIPWLYASEVSDIRLNNVKACRYNGEDTYEIDPYLESVDNIQGLDEEI